MLQAGEFTKRCAGKKFREIVEVVWLMKLEKISSSIRDETNDKKIYVANYFSGNRFQGFHNSVITLTASKSHNF